MPGISGGSLISGEQRAAAARQDFQLNPGGAAGLSARGVPLSLIDYATFDLKANLPGAPSRFQCGLTFRNKVWYLPYGTQSIGSVAHTLVIYDPRYSADPVRDPRAYQQIDLQRLLGSKYTGAVLGGISLNGKVYLCPAFANPTGSAIQSNSHFFMYDSDLGDPDNAAAWSEYDIFQNGVGPVATLAWCGWAGLCTDGNYVYYCPVIDFGTNLPHGTTVRLDTRLPFTQDASWQAFRMHTGAHLLDSGIRGLQGCVWDGRYVWYAPTNNGIDASCKIPRFDTTKTDFAANSDNGWSFVDATTLSTLSAANNGYVGCSYVDDRWVVFIPFRQHDGSYHGNVLRIDTKATASATLSTSDTAWSTFDLTTVDTRAKGYQGGADVGGKFYLCPTNAGDGAPPPLVAWNEEDVRFSNAAAWESFTHPSPPPWCTYFIYDGDSHLYGGGLIDLPSSTSGRVTRYRVQRWLPGESTRAAGRSPSLWFDQAGHTVIGGRQPATSGAQLDVVGAIHASSAIQSDTGTKAQLGTSGSYGNSPIEGATGTSTAGVGNTANTQTVLKTFAIPANLLSADGKGIEWWFEGISATNADTDKEVKVSFGPLAGPTAMFDQTFTNNAANARFNVSGRIIRSGVGAQECSGMMANQAGTCVAQRATLAIDETATTLVIALGGKGTTASDVIYKSGGWRMINP